MQTRHCSLPLGPGPLFHEPDHAGANDSFLEVTRDVDVDQLQRLSSVLDGGAADQLPMDLGYEDRFSLHQVWFLAESLPESANSDSELGVPNPTSSSSVTEEFEIVTIAGMSYRFAGRSRIPVMLTDIARSCCGSHILFSWQ